MCTMNNAPPSPIDKPRGHSSTIDPNRTRSGKTEPRLNNPNIYILYIYIYIKRTDPTRPEPNRTEPNRTRPDRTRSERARPKPAKPKITEDNRTGTDQTRPNQKPNRAEPYQEARTNKNTHMDQRHVLPVLRSPISQHLTHVCVPFTLNRVFY